jgi:hypothetical protein
MLAEEAWRGKAVGDRENHRFIYFKAEISLEPDLGFPTL